MKLLLDTAYLLPAIGISVKELPKDAPIRLMQKGNRISVCDIGIFELSAKGATYVSAGRLPPERVTRGIRAIVYNEGIETIPTYESTLLFTVFKIRSMLNDFIDCLILSAAIGRVRAPLSHILKSQLRELPSLKREGT